VSVCLSFCNEHTLRRSLTLAPWLNVCACANRECGNCTAPWLNVNKLEIFCLTPCRCTFIWGEWRKVRFGDCHVATLDACDDITRVNACAHISYYAVRCALVLASPCPVCWQRTCAPSHFQQTCIHIIQNNSPSPTCVQALRGVFEIWECMEILLRNATRDSWCAHTL
jgi:hypothetical protein